MHKLSTPETNGQGPCPAFTLRPYQTATVTSVLAAVQAGEHPVVALPTGSGKSLVAAAVCAALPGRVLVVSHRQELLEQDAAALQAYAPGTSLGLYSAGLGRRDTHQRVLFAGVQSVYQKMDVLQQAGPFDAVIVDECHLCAPKDASTVMYQAVFAGCPTASRVGLSATPYRLDSGLLYTGPEAWYTLLASHVSMRELTPAYLAPLRGVLTAHNIDTSDVQIRGGEFVANQLAQAAMQEGPMQAAVAEICALGKLRHHWLLFCVDVAHTSAIAELLQARGIATGVITGALAQDERRDTLAAFKAGHLRAIANCMVLTTGFDYPAIDLIALLRPSCSKGLVVQMLGRGARQAEGKADCLILDYGSNLERHAPLDELWDTRKTPGRQAADDRAAREAEAQRQREIQARHDRQASLLDPMEAASRTHTYRVERVAYEVRPSKNPKYPGTTMLVAKYYCPERAARHAGFPGWIWQWVCLEYTGWARHMAEQWCVRRGVDAPRSAEQAYLQSATFKRPVRIRVEEKAYPEIKMEYFAEDEE